MPKISENGGVSDATVDPDYIAPAGVAPQDAMDQGMPDQGVEGDPEDTARQGPNQDSSKIRPAQESATDGKQDESGRTAGISGHADAEVTPAKKATARGNPKSGDKRE